MTAGTYGALDLAWGAGGFVVCGVEARGGAGFCVSGWEAGVWEGSVAALRTSAAVNKPDRTMGFLRKAASELFIALRLLCHVPALSGVGRSVMICNRPVKGTHGLRSLRG